MTDTGELSKRAAFEELLDIGVTALHFDPRADAVRVPPHLKARPWLVLNYSYLYRLADFTVDDDGVFASLSFGGRQFPCYVPWAAVFAVAEDKGDRMHVWQADMPVEVRAGREGRSDPTAAPSPKPALRALEPAAVATPAEVQPPATAEAAPVATPARAPSRRSAFRVIQGGRSGTVEAAERAVAAQPDAADAALRSGATTTDGGERTQPSANLPAVIAPGPPEDDPNGGGGRRSGHLHRVK